MPRCSCCHGADVARCLVLTLHGACSRCHGARVRRDKLSVLDIDRAALWTVIPSSTGARGSDWDAFVSSLSPDKCAYALVEPPVDGTESLVFVVWVPETAKIKDRMIFASRKDDIWRACQPFAEFCIAANDRADLDIRNLREIFDRQRRAIGTLARFRPWNEQRHASFLAQGRAVLVTVLILARSEQPSTRTHSFGLCRLSNVSLYALFRWICRLSFREM